MARLPRYSGCRRRANDRTIHNVGCRLQQPTRQASQLRAADARRSVSRSEVCRRVSGRWHLRGIAHLITSDTARAVAVLRCFLAGIADFPARLPCHLLETQMMPLTIQRLDDEAHCPELVDLWRRRLQLSKQETAALYDAVKRALHAYHPPELDACATTRMNSSLSSFFSRYCGSRRTGPNRGARRKVLPPVAMHSAPISGAS